MRSHARSGAGRLLARSGAGSLLAPGVVVALGALAALGGLVGGAAPAHATAVADGLLGLWRLDEPADPAADGVPAPVADAVGAHAGVLVGGARGEDAPFGTGYRFDGKGDLVSVPDPDRGLKVGAGDFSVGVWFRDLEPEPRRPGARAIVQDSSGVAGYGIGISAEGRLYLHLRDAGGRSIRILAEGPVLDGRWHHAMGVREGDRCALYLDGQLDGDSDAESGGAPDGDRGGAPGGARGGASGGDRGDAPGGARGAALGGEAVGRLGSVTGASPFLRIGGENSGSPFSVHPGASDVLFDGVVDEVTLYGRALAAAEVARNAAGAYLVLTVVPDAELARPGAPLTWSITVENRGPATALDTRVAHELPAGATLVSVAASRGEVAGASSGQVGGEAILRAGNLGPGERARLTVVVAPGCALEGRELASTARATTLVPDGSGGAEVEARVRVAGVAIVGLAVAPPLLRPSRKLREVSLDYSVSAPAGCPAPVCSVAVASSEPPGSASEVLARVRSPRRVLLRAERHARAGRVYELTVSCGSASAVTTVRVPRARRGGR